MFRCLDGCTAPNATLTDVEEIFEEPIVFGACTRTCLRTFNDTMFNHCEGLTPPTDEAQCMFKAFFTYMTCVVNCAPTTTSSDVEEILPEFSPSVFEPEGSK